MPTQIEFISVFDSVVVASTTADAGATVVYTVPSSFDAELSLIMCTNGSATNNISVQVYHADGAAYHHLLRSHSVAGNDTLNVLEASRMFLHAGDKIVAYKGGGTFDVSVSGKHFYNPQRTI